MRRVIGLWGETKTGKGSLSCLSSLQGTTLGFFVLRVLSCIMAAPLLLGLFFSEAISTQALYIEVDVIVCCRGHGQLVFA